MSAPAPPRIVLEVSAAVALLVDDGPAGQWADETIRGATLFAPELIRCVSGADEALSPCTCRLGLSGAQRTLESPHHERVRLGAWAWFAPREHPGDALRRRSAEPARTVGCVEGRNAQASGQTGVG